MTRPRNDSLISALRDRIASAPQTREILTALTSERLEITGASLEARALLLATLQPLIGKPIVVITASESTIEDLEAALRLFHHDPSSIATYPNPSLSPYQEVPPSLAVVRDEIRALGLLINKSIDFLIVPARALYRRLPRAEQFAAQILGVRKGDELESRRLLETLTENGFVRTDLVGEVGEFAFRGGIIDVFPPNSQQPVRIELFGDAVDSIRHFDVESQRSADEMDSVSIYPASQFVMSKPVRAAIAQRLSTDFQEPLYRRDLAEKIDRLVEHGHFPGVENYIPVAVPSTSFADYLFHDPKTEWMVTAIEPDEITSSIDKYETLLSNEYETSSEKGKAVYPPDKVLVSAASIHEFLGHVKLALSSLHVASQEFREIRLKAPQTQRYVNRLSDAANDLLAATAAGRSTVLVVSTKGGAEKVERLFTELSVPFTHEPEQLGGGVTITGGHLATGFDFESAQISVLSEWDLFEPPASARVSKRRSSQAFFTDLRDLKTGDYVVHLDHGVGRFLGLQRVPFGQTEREVMEVEYSSGGKLLLPMESLNQIQKYSGGTDTQPKLDRLGGTTWARTKASVKKAMRDMADELLKLYATRRVVQGFAFSKDSPWQFDFEDAFEFDETDDQMTAIEEIKRDMEGRRPMDRLLCGDVGYGKTEVAMRAAFKAIMDGKQVVVLAPTTILAYQHYRTFLRRFASFPVTIELISRLRNPKEQKEIAAKISTGEIDILIGTHRVLSKDMAFKDLGVLIIDEEQRFGVAQKEKLKQFKKAVDVLSMSATPIPRTLHMSLVGIRDISVIETPPKDRLAIQTAVVPFHDEFIKEAIEFEVGRGGQIFFVHNRVESIYAMKEYIERVAPGVRVIVGHGQMDEQELEDAMMAFIARKYDLLLATTIIENGIDIPACNTILINHAERMGLSQLYQLRGRVGRSDRLAFCYLLVPSDRTLTSDARKRLAAIQEFSDLGAGFRIAARDLEIRGAGNLLGGEQSGQIAAVGLEMYTKLLEETVRELKGEKIEEEIETSMNLGLDIYIPHEYIADENLRLTFYKKIASSAGPERLEDIARELRDRFGALPSSVEGLLEFVALKQRAHAMGVVSIAREGERLAIKFHPEAKIDPNKLVALLEENPTTKFTPAGALTLPVREKGRAILSDIDRLLSSVAVTA